MDDFNRVWEEKNLPYWEENGARCLGSFTNYLGEGKNKTIRLFQSDSPKKFNVFTELRETMFDTAEGVDSLRKIYPYLETIKETVWKSA